MKTENNNAQKESIKSKIPSKIFNNQTFQQRLHNFNENQFILNGPQEN